MRTLPPSQMCPNGSNHLSPSSFVASMTHRRPSWRNAILQATVRICLSFPTFPTDWNHPNLISKRATRAPAKVDVTLVIALSTVNFLFWAYPTWSRGCQERKVALSSFVVHSMRRRDSGMATIPLRLHRRPNHTWIHVASVFVPDCYCSWWWLNEGWQCSKQRWLNSNLEKRSNKK